MLGKGDRQRNGDKEKYDEGYERTFKGKLPPKRDVKSPVLHPRGSAKLPKSDMEQYLKP